MYVPNAPLNCGLCQITKASGVNLPVSQPTISYVPGRAGNYKVVVSVGHKYGLTATYYSGCSASASQVTNIGFPFAFLNSFTQIRDSLPSNFACDAADLKDKISLPVAVRWRGFMVFPHAPLEYRLFAMGDGDFAVWFSSKLVLDKKEGPWSATLFIHSATTAYDVEITYYSNASNCWFNLGWESEAALWGPIWPSVLHSRHDIPSNGRLDVLGKGSVMVTSIQNGTIAITASAHSFAVDSMVVFVVFGVTPNAQILNCSPIYRVLDVPSLRSLRVSSAVVFPVVGELTVANAWAVKLVSSTFFTNTPHGFVKGDVVAFADSKGSSFENGEVGDETVWNCLSSARDYAVASTPTSFSFTLADSPDVLDILNFSCNSQSSFSVRRSVHDRLIVKSGDFCASQSFVLGQNLSLATVGSLFSYPVQLRDSFQNVIAQNAALIYVNFRDSDTNATVNHQMQTSIFMHEGYPTVFISTTVSGSFKVALFDVANGVSLGNSPVFVRVKPHTFCGAASTMQRIMTSTIMNWASRMEFYARDAFGNKITEKIAGYSTTVSSCMPDAGYANLSIGPNGGLNVFFSKSAQPCKCCSNQLVSLTSGPMFNGNGTSGILSAITDSAGVLIDLRIHREGTGYFAAPSIALLSNPLFAVKMVLVNGSDSLTMVLAYSDVKISDDTYSVLYSYPANPGRGRVLTTGLVLVHGGLLATYYALDAQIPLAQDASVFSSTAWATKLTPCLVGVIGYGVTFNPMSCRAHAAAAAVKFSGIVHREGRMAPLVLFMAVYNGTSLKISFASRIVTDATVVSPGSMRIAFYSAVVPMVPSNYQKILTDFHVEYAGEAIPSFSFPLFAGTACSKVFTISNVANVTIGSGVSNSTLFYTSQDHGYSTNATIVRLFGALPSPLSPSILYRVCGVSAPSTFSLSVLGESSAFCNVVASPHSGPGVFVEEVHGTCGMRAPFDLGSAYVSVALV
jgi:hypothetical protein